MMALGGRANLPPAALEVSNRFKKRYEPKQLEPIWRALRQCYGSEELVLQAVREKYSHAKFLCVSTLTPPDTVP